MKVFLPLYALALLVLTPQLSLWLDEILTLIGAVEPSTSSLLDYIKTVPGGTPLAFLAPRWSIQMLGYSPFAARLPSVLASIAACPAIYLLARRMKLQTPLLAVIAFALWPLQFRYAMEARPYALALALSVWSTEVFLSCSRTWLYVVLTALAVLAQPYAIFVTAGHLAWALLYERRSLRAPLAALASSALVLIPWYSYFSAEWAGVTASQQLAALDPRSALVFLHEITGSGYAGAAILLTGIALAARRAPPYFWLLCTAVPLLLVFAANTTLHYFFATRQLIYILPALVLLFTLGAESSGRFGKILLLLFLAASLYEDINWFHKPREDWQSAANAIERHVAAGACITFLADTTPVYLFFHPGLASHVCKGPQDRVVITTSPYIESQDYAPATLTLQSKQSFNGPAIEVYAK